MIIEPEEAVGETWEGVRNSRIIKYMQSEDQLAFKFFAPSKMC